MGREGVRLGLRSGLGFLQPPCGSRGPTVDWPREPWSCHCLLYPPLSRVGNFSRAAARESQGGEDMPVPCSHICVCQAIPSQCLSGAGAPRFPSVVCGCGEEGLRPNSSPIALSVCSCALLLRLCRGVGEAERSAGGAWGPRMTGRRVAGAPDRNLEGGADTQVQADPPAGGGGVGVGMEALTFCQEGQTPEGQIHTPSLEGQIPNTPLIRLTDPQRDRHTGSFFPTWSILGWCLRALGELDGSGGTALA